MEPWTVDAWIAFLTVFVASLKALAWPSFGIFVVCLFRRPITEVIRRIKKITTSGAEIGPLEQEKVEQKDFLKEILEADYGPAESHLKVWLDQIRTQVKGLEESGAANLHNRLVFALAESQRYANFFQILREIYGSQINLLNRLAQAGRLSKESILEANTLHVERTGDSASPIEAWVSFLTYYSLAMGDRNSLEITIYGKDFLEFLANLNENVETRLY